MSLFIAHSEMTSLNRKKSVPIGQNTNSNELRNVCLSLRQAKYQYINQNKVINTAVGIFVELISISRQNLDNCQTKMSQNEITPII